MWVIYANTADGDFDYFCEDKIVYDEFFMSGNVSEAKFFNYKEEAIKFADILYDKIKFDIKRNLFVSKLTVNRDVCEYVGYYGGDLARRF